MSEQTKITVQLARQPEDDLWLATSRDLPGLFVEGETPDSLMDEVRPVIMAMLELANDPRHKSGPMIDFEVTETDQ